MSEGIIGHENILDFFAKIRAANRLGHAYCFIGKRQVGKMTLARRVASQLLETHQDKLMTHPDILIVAQEINEKTGKTKKNIDVDQLRKLRSSLAQGALMGKYKVAIIDQADRMSLGAANALLKTLEEPKKNTIIFLLAEDEDSLPDTIKSRCNFVYFNPVSKSELQSYLNGVGNMSEEVMKDILEYANGLPGRVVDWVNDPDSFQNYKTEINRFLSLINKPFHEKLHIVDDLFGDKKDHILARDNLQNIMSIWQTLLRSMILKETNLDTNKLLNTEKSVNKAKSLVNKNIHPRLLVESIILNLP